MIATAQPSPDEVRQRLAQWRAAGAGHAQPLQLATLEALARRAATRQGRPRQQLEQRLAQLAGQFADAIAAAPPAPATPGQSGRIPAPGPLAEVTARLEALALERHGAVSAGAMPEMAMLGELRRLWAQVRSESQLQRSLQDLPEDAGPLNSGKLVYRALNLMGGLSPQYLRHFLAHLDALAWIGQVQPPTAPAAPGTAAPARKRSRRTPRAPG